MDRSDWQRTPRQRAPLRAIKRFIARQTSTFASAATITYGGSPTGFLPGLTITDAQGKRVLTRQIRELRRAPRHSVSGGRVQTDAKDFMQARRMAYDLIGQFESTVDRTRGTTLTRQIIVLSENLDGVTSDLCTGGHHGQMDEIFLNSCPSQAINITVNGENCIGFKKWRLHCVKNAHAEQAVRRSRPLSSYVRLLKDAFHWRSRTVYEGVLGHRPSSFHKQNRTQCGEPHEADEVISQQNRPALPMPTVSKKLIFINISKALQPERGTKFCLHVKVVASCSDSPEVCNISLHRITREKTLQSLGSLSPSRYSASAQIKVRGFPSVEVEVSCSLLLVVKI